MNEFEKEATPFEKRFYTPRQITARTKHKLRHALQEIEWLLPKSEDILSSRLIGELKQVSIRLRKELDDHDLRKGTK